MSNKTFSNAVEASFNVVVATVIAVSFVALRVIYFGGDAGTQMIDSVTRVIM